MYYLQWNMMGKLLPIFCALFCIFIDSLSSSSSSSCDCATTSNHNEPRLRIAIANNMYVIPPKKSGGTERILYYLIEELVRRGHNVTLFSVVASNTSATLIAHPAFKYVVVAKQKTMAWHAYVLWTIEQLKRRAADFDIVHAHMNEAVGMLPPALRNRSVTTWHWPIDGNAPFFDGFPALPLVSISDDQRLHAPNAQRAPRWVSTVYHGLPLGMYKLNTQPAKRPYLAFIGRMGPEKGPDWAIQIALRAGIPLKMAGASDFKTPWEQALKKQIDAHPEQLEFVGAIGDAQKQAFFGDALALLFPSIWSEPFGIVMIEAMSTGTPVIGRRLGSVPEIVEEGVTGLMFDTVDQAVAAVKRAPALDRRAVRAAFEKRFSAEAMVDGYERVYRQLIAEDKQNRLHQVEQHRQC